MNVTFEDSTTGGSLTVGANQTSLSVGTASRGRGSTTDGIIREEGSKLDPGQNLFVRQSVPVTREQFEALSRHVNNLIESKHTYDYSLFSGPNGHAQTCATFANSIYEATGHPGQVGDLFTLQDMLKAPGLVWDFMPGIGTLDVGFVPDYVPTAPINGHVVNTANIAPQHCFTSDTPIQMWPLDPSIKPRADGTYDEQLVLSRAWEKPISEISVGDLVISYDDKGRIKPGPVTRTMQNRATHILDFWNTGVTPGHAYYCADGKFKDQHVPLMDILRTDSAIMRADGTTIRAATDCEVGSMGDMIIHAAATMQKPDGTWSEPKRHAGRSSSGRLSMQGNNGRMMQKRWSMVNVLAVAIITSFYATLTFADQCVGYGKSKYSDVNIDDLNRIIFETKENVIGGGLIENGVLYFANPVSQLFLGVKAIEEQEFGIAIAHLDLASHLIWKSELCGEKNLAYFTFVARKFALEEGVLTGLDRDAYFNMTTGLINRPLEMLSQEFHKMRQCLVGMVVDPASGVLDFNSC
jgi:hypothetical protein